MRPPRGPGEEPRVRVGADGEDAFGDHRADFLDEGDLAGAFAFGVLVDESAGCGGGLPADGPDPVLGVDVAGADAGDLADAGGGRGGEDDDLAPSSVVVVGSVGECLVEAEQGGPVAQGEGAGVVEFVLGLFVLVLQPVTRAGLTVMIPSRTACSMTRTRTARLFLTVERLCWSVIQPWTVRSTAPLVIIRAGKSPRAGTTWQRQPASRESPPAVTTTACATAVPRSLLRVLRILPQLVEKLVDGCLRLHHRRAGRLPPGVDRLDAIARAYVGNGQPRVEGIARQSGGNGSAAWLAAAAAGVELVE